MAEYTSYANSLANSSLCNAEPGNNGNIGYIADNLNAGWTQSFTYDGLNRLTSGARSDGGYNHTYNYDSFDNLLIQDNLNPTYNINPATNQLNRINPVTQTSLYAYDAAGNIISTDTSMGTGISSIGGHSFTYNALSQLTAVDAGQEIYFYNGLDERIYKGTQQGWVNYDYLNGQVMQDYTNLGLRNDYIFAEGQRIAKVATTLTGIATTNYYLDDHLGTTQVELDASGNVTWSGQFTPFGAELDAGGTTMHYKFTGKERDAESGLDNFGARYYGSGMGRMMSPDWSAKAEPVPYAKLPNPQSLNLYAYVGNNPLSRTDLTGHYQCSGTKDQCAQIQTGLDLAKAAQNKLGADSKEGKAIGAVLKFYGSSTDKNGVNVSFGDLKKGTLGVTTAGEKGTVNIKFDLKQIDGIAAHTDRGGVFAPSERAGTEVHEGTHGTDIRKWGGGAASREQVDFSEHHAYTNESFVYKGLGVNSAIDLSTPQAIDAAAARSVAEDCAGGACKP